MMRDPIELPPGTETIPRDFERDFMALATNRRPTPVELDDVTAWQLMITIQLACRHPDFDGPVRETAEKFARQLQTPIATTPALKRVADQGWDTTHDVQHGPPPREAP